MATVILGCDRNNSNDSTVQNTVAKILEKAGHKVEKLAIAPNPFAKYSYSNKAKGKIGVYLMAASLFSVADLYGGNTNFKYAYFGIRGDASNLIKSQNDFDTKKIPKDGDCTSVCNKLAGKSYKEMNEITKSKCQCVFGATGQELGDNILKAMGGKTSSSNTSDSVTSIKEALTDVLYNWDGDAECILRGDTVYINKIPSPTSAKLSLIEGKNIDMGSVNVSDYNPSAINHLTCDFNQYSLSIQDDYLIKRFGKISSHIQIDKNIKTLKAAKEFLQREWNKTKRDNGHSLELKTFGHSQWQHGKWCRVYLPSFNIDDYMYITKVSQEDSQVWDCNLTLVDWPPGFGEPSVTDDDSKSDST